MTRALIISAPRSSSGKTTVTLGLLAALRRRGIAVRAAKSGPDYIDPAFHAAATGAAGINLDTWAMAPALIDALVRDATRDADVLVIEGAMGLFDGVPGEAGRSGAAADVAARLDAPVLLVIDVSGQSQSAAAVVAGFARFDPQVRLAGVILNRVGSERHRALVTDAIAPLGVPVLGTLGWCRRASMGTWRQSWRDSVMRSTSIAMSMRSWQRPRRGWPGQARP
jgi:cobyrinic acid a,c-diamide synthase